MESAAPGAMVTLAVGFAIAAIGVGVARHGRLTSGDRVERWATCSGFGFVVVTWLGVLFAETGAFTRVAFLGSIVVLGAAALAAGSGGHRVRTPARVSPSLATALVLITIGAGSLYLPAFDVRLEARDPGTYALAAESLARRGTLDFVDPTVARLPPATRAYLFPAVGPERAFEGSRYLGFYLEERDRGLVVPQAQPVYVVWGALAHWAAGADGVLAAAALLTWLGALVLAVLGRALFGPPGSLAGLGFALGVVPAWFARYSAAESAAVLLVALGTLGLYRFRSGGQVVHALLAAFAFGLCPLAKTELVVLYGPLALLGAVDLARSRLDRKALTWFWLPLSLLLAHTGWHAVRHAWPYHFDVLRQFELRPAEFLMLAAAAAAALLVGALAGRFVVASWQRLPRSRGRVASTVVRWLLGLAPPAFMAWAYILRPRMYLATGGDGWNMANALELGLAVSPWLLVLAAIGGTLVLVQRQPALTAALFPLLCIATLIIVESNIIPTMMWAFRRMLPVVLPALYLLAVAALAAAWRVVVQRAGPVAAAIVVAVVAAPVAWHHATTAPWLRSHQEFPGATRVIDELRAVVRPRDTVVFEPRTERGLVRFEAVTGLSIGASVYRLPGRQAREEILRSLAYDARRRGGRLLVATTGELDGLVSLAADPVHEILWRTHQLESIATSFHVWGPVRDADPEVGVGGLPLRLPRALDEQIYTTRIYELDVSRRMSPLPERAVAGELRGELDVGLWDDLHLVGGFLHEPESDPVNNYRWTSGRGIFLLPGMPADAVDVVVRAGHNPLLADQVVNAWLDGRPLGTRTIVEGWQDLRFPVPDGWRPPASGVARLEIRVPAVVPSSADTTFDDDRPVGVRVERVFWTRALPGSER